MCGEFVAIQIAFFIMHVCNLCAHFAYFVVGDFIFGPAKYKRKVGNEKPQRKPTASITKKAEPRCSSAFGEIY